MLTFLPQFLMLKIALLSHPRSRLWQAVFKIISVQKETFYQKPDSREKIKLGSTAGDIKLEKLLMNQLEARAQKLLGDEILR